MTTLAIASICSAASQRTIGSRITDRDGFLRVACRAIETFDFAAARVPGQGFILCPDAVPFVSAGIGLRSTNPDDYVLRSHRGRVAAYLKRPRAAAVSGCALVVYTREAYVRDPDVAYDDVARIENATHVLVAVLAYAGPADPPLTPYRLVWNLGGGNREAALYTADELRAKAKDCIDYDAYWAVVAD